jgi:hypothetical protein
MDSRKMKILKLLKFTSKNEDGNLVSAEKLFVANRVLTNAYQLVDEGSMKIENLSSYIQALIEYRDDKLDFKFEIDEQTGKERVYFTRLGESLHDYYANMFRPSFQNSNLGGHDDAEEEDDSEGS